MSSDAGMNRNNVLTIIFLLFSSTWFNPAPIYASFNKALNNYSESVVASPNTIWVPDNYTTIQEAINVAEEGKTILVRAGTYYEHLKIDKSLILVGENRGTTVIDGTGTGIVVYVIANNITLSNFTIQNGQLGIWLRYSGNNVLTGNTVSENSYGLHLWGSDDNILTNNIISNNSYGLHLWGSDDNILTNNIISNNSYGFYLYVSNNNTLTSNTALNNSHGIYLESSSNNVLSDNTISNNDDGIHLYHSSNNILTGNTATDNSQYGIYVGDSDNNVFSGNTALNNSHGIYVFYSSNNILTGNTATDNSQYGVRFSSSSINVIFHNNFINNTEPSRSVDSVNSWDNGAEGNYWSDYDGADANWDGIGDAPYPIDENSQDNYPLMAMFLQFKVATENQSYKVNIVCNSTISNFQYRYDPDSETNSLGFKVNSTEAEGFCRISVPHALVKPPHVVTVDHNPPLGFKIVNTNGTHTWLCFIYDHLEHEITIVHTSSIERLILLSQLAIFGLAVITVVLLLISINYHRMFKEQKKIAQAYERELGSLPASHPDLGRALFIKDAIERKEKIEKFEKKYGIKIQAANTFEDLMKKIGIEKEKVKD
jgi:parallel beta-helix repeat protein